MKAIDEDVLDDIRTDIVKHEGVVFAIYLDHLGNKTMGIGHLVTDEDKEHALPVGYAVSEDRVMEVFEEDVDEALRTASRLVPNLKDHPASVQKVIVNMAFNLGYSRLKGFKRMLKAVSERKYDEASYEMLNSRWAKQVKRRAVELSNLMLSAQESRDA